MKRLTLAVLLCLAIGPTYAQLQSPAAFLGYELGDKFTQHYRVVDYFKHIAAQSAMVKLTEYGKTYEGRPLLLAYITSEENMEQLETIRTDNLKRAGMMTGTPSTAVSIVWLSYNVHGNEASSTEASMATIYKLITEHKDWLKQTVVIIDPCINPDGRDRYVNFYQQTAQMPFNPDGQSSEHDEPWPGGRQNHYLFDLNRDWAWQTQIESQERIEEYNKWLPQVHVDFHEQGYNSPYYFAPAAEPYHELITPWQRQFQQMIGKNHAKYFDKNNWFYFTKQFFDLLYPSYGDTYPTYNGAIGMTYEQAGGGRGGLGIIKQEGDTLTLLDRLTHHTTTGLSTVEITTMNNSKVLSEFEKFFKTPVSGTYKSFVLKSDNTGKMHDLKAWLDKNKIEYGTAANVKGLKGYNYQTKRSESFTIKANDLVISVNQPKGVLAKILFEPQTNLSDSLTYDITAWAVPYFYGLQAYATATALKVNVQKSARDFQANDVPDHAYAFFFKWQSFDDAKMLSALLKADIKVRFSRKKLNINGQTFLPGTLIVAKRDNGRLGNKFETTIVELANANRQDFTVIATGFMDNGPDLGSRNVSYLKKPKIAMLRGEGVSTTNYGANWFYLEQELGYPFSALNAASLSRLDLAKYQIIIMQDGRYSDFGDPQMKKLSDWVGAGGKLIVIGNSVSKFADSDYSGLSKYNSEEEKQSFEEKRAANTEENKLKPYDQGRREYARKMVPGAIFKLTLDNTHPLAYGYDDHFYSLKTSASRYGYLKSQNVGIIKSSADHMSGFAGEYVKEDIGKSMVIGVESKGRGQIVFFVDNPLFRDFWYNSKLMFANALFFVGQD
jgi:Zinc carboxypeptidase